MGLVWQSATAMVMIMILSSILLGLLKAAGRKVRTADVLQHFAWFGWLGPIAAAIVITGYYFLTDGFAAILRSWVPPFAVIAFLTQAAAIRRPAAQPDVSNRVGDHAPPHSDRHCFHAFLRGQTHGPARPGSHHAGPAADPGAWPRHLVRDLRGRGGGGGPPLRGSGSLRKPRP